VRLFLEATPIVCVLDAGGAGIQLSENTRIRCRRARFIITEFLLTIRRPALYFVTCLILRDATIFRCSAAWAIPCMGCRIRRLINILTSALAHEQLSEVEFDTGDSCREVRRSHYEKGVAFMPPAFSMASGRFRRWSGSFLRGTERIPGTTALPPTCPSGDRSQYDNVAGGLRGPMRTHAPGTASTEHRYVDRGQLVYYSDETDNFTQPYSTA